MNQGKYVFAQVTEFLPKRIFDRIASGDPGDKHVCFFSCWHQMLCMVFGRLTNRNSLHHLIVTITDHSNKYHLGLGGKCYPRQSF